MTISTPGKKKNVGGEGGKNKPRVLDHPSHFFSCALVCSDNKVSFIFSVLVVHHDKEFTVGKAFKGIAHGVK